MQFKLSGYCSIYFFLLLFLLANCHPQKELSEVEKLEYLAKSWGLAKYHHPDIGTGKIDWDSILIEHINFIRLTKSNDAFNEALNKMLEIPNKVTPLSTSIKCKADSIEQLVDFSWIMAEALTQENQQLLQSFLNAKGIYKNKYVSDSTNTRSLGYARFYEDPMEDADLTKVELRLLGLFRYWNIIEYFFPYKNLTDKDWHLVLSEYIPRFINAADKEAYYEELLLLSTAINDGHANIPYHPDLRAAFFGRFTVPFTLKFLEDQFIVDGIKSDSLASISNIQIGDMITSINGLPISQRSQKLSPYLPKPNKAFQNEETCRYLLNGNSGSIDLEILRNAESLAFQIQRYSFSDIRKSRDKKQVEPWKIMDGNLGYAHMGELTLEMLPDFFSGISHTDGLLLDFRHYPNWEILYDFLSHFYKEKKPFALLKSQCLDKPGTYYWHLSTNDLSSIELKENPYDKQIVLLVDENTLSFGEYFVMAMQMLENVQVIGSQTAGEDGNQVGIDMPGGMRMFLSSLGIYYPNGKNTQRSGIKIDQIVSPTIDDIQSGTDRVFNVGLEWLNYGD